MPNEPQEQPKYWYNKARDLLRPNINRHLPPVQFNREDPTKLPFFNGYHNAEVTADTTSKVLFVPQDLDELTVVVVPAGTARIEFSVSSVDDIVTGNATWSAWDEGDVTETTSAVFSSPITALRLVTIGDTATWEVRQ